MNSQSLRVDWCTKKAAEYAVTHWHYSRTLPNQKLVCLGVWESESFVGCVLFGDGANAGMFKPYGLDYTQGCELVRVALREHETPVSRIVAIALRFLKKKCPKLRLVVSFADPEQGHVGGIYQAGGWIYAGMTTAADEYLVNGRRVHGRALRSTRTTHRLKNVVASNVLEWARLVLDPKASRVDGSSKYRYLMPLDTATRALILPLSRPYPKKKPRAENSSLDGTTIEEGSATLTSALQ